MMSTRRQLRRLNSVLGLVVLTAFMPPLEMAAQAEQPFMPQVAYQRLDSLEQTALSDTSLEARYEAVSTIASISLGQGTCVSGSAPSAIKYPGVVNSLSSIYWRSQDDHLRREILAKMLWQAECDEAVAFLAEAAEETAAERMPRGDFVIDGGRGTSQSGAVSILVAFGPRGESALRRLYNQGSVRDSMARASLEVLARNEFRWPKNREGQAAPFSAESQDRPPARAPANERLDSLERVALNDTTPAGRLRATAAIANVGKGQADCADPAPSAVAYHGVVRRLASIYQRSHDAEVRRSILGMMVSQAECDEAVAFLTDVAEELPSALGTREITNDRSPATPQSSAVFLLLKFGPRGDSALRRLHNQGSVRDSFALASLDNLSSTGFRRLAQTPRRTRAPLPIDAYDHLDSLEHAALTGSTFAARLAAVSSITRIGLYEGNCREGSIPSNVKYTGLVSRLSSIYWRSTDASLRGAILGRMLWHAECAEAVKFLVAAAEEPPPPPLPPGNFVTDGFRNTLQSDAVSLLLSFGDLGEQALRRLHSEGTVRDSFARELLEKLAGNDFKRPN